MGKLRKEKCCRTSGKDIDCADSVEKIRYGTIGKERCRGLAIIL